MEEEKIKLEENEEKKEMTGEARMEEEDEVLEEMDVFFTTRLHEHLHVFQYPLRPTWRPYEMKNLEEVVHSNQSPMFRLQFKTDKDPQTYNSHSSVNIDHFNLTSSTVPVNCHYAVGKISGCLFQHDFFFLSYFSTQKKTLFILLAKAQLHLSPVKSIQQFRPLLSCLSLSRDEESFFFLENVKTRGAKK